VEAKNKDVLGYGPEVQKTVKTIQGKPTPVRNLTYHNTTTSKIIAVWEVPERPAGVIKYYNVSATQTKTNDLKKEDVIGDTQYEFTGLAAGEGYTVTVIACNEKQCSYEETREMWTQPNRPQLTSETEWITASPSTVTVGLPSLSLDSPPVVLWVVVTETVGDEETSPARAEEVKRQAVDLVNKTSSRLKRDLSDQTWIAAEIDLNGMGNEFVVGDNQTHGGFYNQPLEENGKYWVTVIAETRAGPHRVFSSSIPDLYIAVTPTSVASWVVPLLLLVMVCLTVAGYFLWR
ncbi:receptor-type tyrosine-protein phosphatase mu-like, partial [Homarus americanus]|uniref:receptor-type tyrosine-protein phosphatase mu-like n=1 Tax=Homarus americanus TaxID=6706 RepID=UPI001C47FFFA